MAITETFFDPDLATGSNDGTSEANAWQTWSQMQTDHVAGERVNAKNPASPFQPGANIAFAISATDLLISIFRGYGSTIGDGTKFQFDLETANTFTVSGEAVLLQTVDVVGADISNLIVLSGDIDMIEDFSTVNTGTSTNNHTALQISDNNAMNGYVENNSTTSTDGTGQALRMSRSSIANLEITATRVGVFNTTSSKSGSVVDCLIYEKGTGGLSGYYFVGAAAYAGGIHSGVTINGFDAAVNFPTFDAVVGSTTPFIMLDSIISNATVGIKNVDNATLTMAANFSTIAFFNCGTDTQLGDNEVINKISLTADPYTNASSNDFSLNNTAGGGADCRAAAKFGGV